MTLYSYLTLVNIYSLLDDPTVYVKAHAVILTLASLAFSLFNDLLYRVRPGRLFPVMYVFQGGSLFLYGVVMSQGGWSPYLRLGVAVLFTVPLGLTSHFYKTYFQRHVFIELGRVYGVKLGVINSAHSVIESLVVAGQVVIAGQIYNVFSLEWSALIFCTTYLVLSSAAATLSYFLFRDYSGIPTRNKPLGTLLGNVIEPDPVWADAGRLGQRGSC